MNSIRRWLYGPKKTDKSLLASFFFADEELNLVAAELDSFDGSKNPERCTSLVNKLRSCQDKVLVIIQKIIDDAVFEHKANRDYRVKFPDDVQQDNLAGQLWFGAECLAAGSSIMNREVESATMRPLARALSKNLDSLRTLLREQCLQNINIYTERIKEALIIFDKLFAEFELSYVSAMVPVKTMKDYDMVQEVTVLFSETTQRAIKEKLISQDMIDDYDPALMFTIPRLAILSGLIFYVDGPLNPENEQKNMPEMFRPFQSLLQKIRDLLHTLSPEELMALEKALCSAEEPDIPSPVKSPSSHSQTSQRDGDTKASTSCPSGQVLDKKSKTDTSHLSHNQSVTQTQMISPPLLPVFSVIDAPLESPLGQVLTPTIASDTLDRISETTDSGMRTGLNKSESRDSGLQSENVSTSDSLQFDQVSLATTTEETQGASCSTSSESSPQKLTASKPAVRNKNLAPVSVQRREPPVECGDDVRNMCEGIICDLIDSVVEQTLPCLATENDICSDSNSMTKNSSPKPEMGTEGKGHRENTCSIALNREELYRHNWEAVNAQEDSDLGFSESGEPAAEAISSFPSNFASTSDDSGPTCQVVAPEVQGHLLSGDFDTRITENLSQVSVEVRTPTQSTSNIIPQSPIYPDNRLLDNMGDQGHCQGDDNSYAPCPIVTYPESVSSEASNSHDWDDSSSGSGTETSSYNSDTRDDEEISLAIQAAEIAYHNEARSQYCSTRDLIHRLFVCISGVADQLQTNYAGDLRQILKSVFEMNSSEPLSSDVDGKSTSPYIIPITGRGRGSRRRSSHRRQHSNRLREPPQWVPDDQVTLCTSCKTIFSFVRRRHHCRNCGKIFCGRCSSNSVPLPHFGHNLPVRVCNRCYMFQVTPFTVRAEH